MVKEMEEQGKGGRAGVALEKHPQTQINVEDLLEWFFGRPAEVEAEKQ
jgi:hypothetical protein